MNEILIALVVVALIIVAASNFKMTNFLCKRHRRF